jgi:hypothetical protein
VRPLHPYLPWPEIHRLSRLTSDWERQRNDAPRYNIAPRRMLNSQTRTVAWRANGTALLPVSPGNGTADNKVTVADAHDRIGL